MSLNTNSVIFVLDTIKKSKNPYDEFRNVFPSDHVEMIKLGACFVSFAKKKIRDKNEREDKIYNIDMAGTGKQQNFGEIYTKYKCNKYKCCI